MSSIYSHDDMVLMTNALAELPADERDSLVLKCAPRESVGEWSRVWGWRVLKSV